MNRKLLEQPFSPEQIKQRVGNFGQTLDYIPGHSVIQRLNDVFDGQWSFQVESHEILESEVIVLGRLTAESVSKTQFGSSTVTRAKSSGDIISLADDLKAASTDSLKKCATMFGVGLHIYSGNSPAAAKHAKEPAQGASAIQNAQSIPDAAGTAVYCPDGVTSGGGNDNISRLSSKQHSFILSLASERNVSRKELDELSKKRFSTVVSYLSKGDASRFIQEMTTH